MRIAALLLAIAAGMAAQETPDIAAPDGRFDLVAAENGGRVEWATSQANPASYLLAATRFSGWRGRQGVSEEIVFSFFNHQTALVDTVLVNPWTRENNDRPADIEIWVSLETSTDGFTQVAAGTLTGENRLQAVSFPAVDARFVKLRVVSTTSPTEGGKPGGFATGASRVRVLEAERPGYRPLLARSPALAALAKGEIPSAPLTAAAPVPPPEGLTSCSVPAFEPPKTSRFTQSKHVLVIADDPNTYRAVAWKAEVNDTRDQTRRIVVPGVSFSWMTPAAVAPAHLIADETDTVVFSQVCATKKDLSEAFKQALLAWIAAGHKAIFQDSDYCAGHNTPDYDFLPYPFATVNPGAFGASGDAGVLENSTLASSSPTSPAFLDTDSWKTGPNDLGDSNVIVKYDARWCGAMWARNSRKKNGLALAYARYGRGLIIYDGYDADQNLNAVYRKLAARELLQPFDPDHLPCSQPMGSFIITTEPGQKSQYMAAGRTYTYPISVRGNFGYSGAVSLDTAVLPADPAVTVKLERARADLQDADEANLSLTVSTGPAATLTSKVVAVRGRDAEGRSNVLCLDLPERKTGGVSVISGLRTDKPPTKNVEIILDASGSMKALLGKRTRWATAMAVLKDVVTKLPQEYSVGLRAYGHTLPSTNPGTCRDSALVVPVAPLNPDALLAAAGKLAPRGETPLVYSILQTPADLRGVGGGTVILITDGEESCKGDFAAAQQELQAAGLNLTLNIVGFTLKNAPAQAQLTTLAESTGGHYYGAPDGQALARALLLAAVDRLPYRILDGGGKQVASGEAGDLQKHELPPGAYTLAIAAAGDEVRAPFSVALAQDLSLRAVIKGDTLAIESQ